MTKEKMYLEDRDEELIKHTGTKEEQVQSVLHTVVIKLNLGCGTVKKQGYINVDKSKDVFPNRIEDIENGLSFPNNYFNEIYSSHMLEHIKPDKWAFCLEEINRVAKDGCILHLILPFDNIKTRTDSDHYRTFSWWSFLAQENGNHYNYFSPLKLERIEAFPNKFIRLFYALFPILKNEIEFKYKIIKSSIT